MGHEHKGNMICCAVSHCSTVKAPQQQHSPSLLQRAVVMAPTSPVRIGLHHSQATSGSMLHHREVHQAFFDGIGEAAVCTKQTAKYLSPGISQIRFLV